jgi:hypothetical protein
MGRVIDEGTVRSLSMLAVDGKDIAALGFCGTEIGKVLMRLLRAAALGECANVKDALLKIAKDFK